MKAPGAGEFPPVASLIPQGPGMVLLDRMVAMGEDWGECEVTIRPDSLFCAGGAVPAHVGIEYMAQTLGALEGLWRVRAGKPVQVGLLLGARSYRSEVGRFEVGWTLRVRASQLLKAADGVSAFACEITHGGRRLAHAEIKAYQPDDIEPYLNDLAKELQ